MNILIISTEEYLTLRLMKCLTTSGNSIHVLGAGSGKAVRASRRCCTYQAFDRTALTDINAALCDVIGRVCREQAIDVILPSGIESVFFLATFGESLPVPTLPVPPVGLLRTLNNKWLFSRLLKQHGLPFPKSRLLERAEDARDLDFPIIVKPLDLDASRGVVRCNSLPEVEAHLRQANVHLPLLVQEFIPGDDIGLGLLARDGEILAWTIQRQLPDGSGVEFIAHDDILEIGRRILAECCYDGIAHFDLRRDSRDGSVKMLECNPRFWASLPFCMLAGVNFAELGMRLALNRPLPENSFQPSQITFPTKALSKRGRLSQPSKDALRFTLADPVPNLLLGAEKLRCKIQTLLLRNPCEAVR